MEETFKFWWDDVDGIARGIVQGELNEQEAERMYQDFLEIIENRSEKTDWLIDLSKLTRVAPKARKILVEATKKARVRKNAFVGASIYIKVLSEFVRFAAGRKDARYFTSEEEALKWLKE